MSGEATEKRPMTYFLQEAMTNGLDAILARLDRDMGNRPYFELRILPVPLLGHAIWDNGDMSSRYLDAFILAGQATGRLHPEEERTLLGRMEACDPYEHPFMVTRVLITSVDLFLREPDAANRRRIDTLIDLIYGHLTIEDGCAYLFKSPEGWNSIRDAVFGDFSPYSTYPIGGIMLALARYLEVASAPSAEALMNKLVRFVVEKSGIFTKEGHYHGHTHSGGILTAAAGMARWAVHTRDEGLLRQMKGTFDWTVSHSSSWGWVPDGLGEKDGSSETCSITDAIHLGLVMARHVDPAYYETIERFARNQLLENQFKENDVRDEALGLRDNPMIAHAFHGSWASWSKPNSLDNALGMVEGCCLGSGIRGCFLVWDDVVGKKGELVSVNMAFSRNSPWVEVVSHQPYQGRIDLVVHDAQQLQIRIPSWADDRKMTVSINKTDVSACLSTQRYLQLKDLKEGDTVTISYPQRKMETCECVNGTDYGIRWRGDTVTGISPVGSIHPIFERSRMETEETPMTDCKPYGHQSGGPVHW